jgi:hypothetical protein
MIDPELKQELDSVRSTLEDIRESVAPTRWGLFVQGLWRAAGYVAGLVIAVVAIGWILTVLGVIPFFAEFSSELKEILDDMRSK